ncbi:hypothetical protein OPAG_05332 [Rhodococcus opacus PD630]|nr:hypothetical protein Pd630_LPD04812 [Rhodococcus opacus PD630]EHI45298.1 hypothetical protein OPAG_05332 [Rhodococcus opacus PD630]
MRLPFEAARVSPGQHRKSSRRTTGFASRRSDLQWLTMNGAARSPRNPGDSNSSRVLPNGL